MISNKKSDSLTRRRFLEGLSSALAASPFFLKNILSDSRDTQIIKPPRLQSGDTVGLIAPASAAFETKTIREGVETLQSLGFKVKAGQHIKEKRGYLAGSDDMRVGDLHQMFNDDEVKAIVALRGGYGSMRLLNLIDYDLIKKNPKIFIGYSDITALNLAIYQKTGLVTFHGPVAISSFSKYTQQYFLQVLCSSQPLGEIKHPDPDNPLRPTAHLNTIRSGKATGRLVGGNLTLFTALLGTLYEVDTKDTILFLEETGEEPYDVDRMLTQLLLAGKLGHVAGIVFDKCSDCKPSDYKPAFYNTFSLEEVLEDRLGQLNCPVLYGMNVGHEADKPTLPIGIKITLDANRKVLIFEEAAVV
jgi:muramoyltetrapeptide carboxypeptidase